MRAVMEMIRVKAAGSTETKARVAIKPHLSRRPRGLGRDNFSPGSWGGFIVIDHAQHERTELLALYHNKMSKVRHFNMSGYNILNLTVKFMQTSCRAVDIFGHSIYNI